LLMSKAAWIGPRLPSVSEQTNGDPLTTRTLNNLLRLIGCLLHFARCISLAARSTRTGM